MAAQLGDAGQTWRQNRLFALWQVHEINGVNRPAADDAGNRRSASFRYVRKSSHAHTRS
jgi:hypothetical protein